MFYEMVCLGWCKVRIVFIKFFVVKFLILEGWGCIGFSSCIIFVDVLLGMVDFFDWLGFEVDEWVVEGCDIGFFCFVFKFVDGKVLYVCICCNVVDLFVFWSGCFLRFGIGCCVFVFCMIVS